MLEQQRRPNYKWIEIMKVYFLFTLRVIRGILGTQLCDTITQGPMMKIMFSLSLSLFSKAEKWKHGESFSAS